MSAAVVILVQKRIIRRLEDAGAWSTETARTLPELGCRNNWLLRRLVVRGAIREVGDGRFHLDRAGLLRYRRRLTVLRVIALVVLVVGTVLLVAL